MSQERTEALTRPASHPHTRRFWYEHGWNRDLSWKLMLQFGRAAPAFLKPPIHFLASSLFFALLSSERKAVCANLHRAMGRSRGRTWISAFRLFHNFSYYLADFVDLEAYHPNFLAEQVEGKDEITALVWKALERKKGLLVLTLHQGHYEVGLALLGELGVPVTAVVDPGPRSACGFEEKVRSHYNVRILRLKESSSLGLELLLALRRNEIVTLQVDRSIGSAARRVPFFGSPAFLPVGPLFLAAVARSPMLVVVNRMLGHRRYRLIFAGPLEPPAVSTARGWPEEEAVRQSHADLVRLMEGLIRECPEQWFNFFEIWPAEAGIDASDAHGPAPG